MTPRRFSALVLATILLLSQTAAVSAHAHASDTQLRGVSCAASHGSDEALAPGTSAPGTAKGPVVHSGDDHVHECIGCQLGSKRLRTATDYQSFGALGATELVAMEHPGSSVSLWLDGHRSPRGPPAV